MQLIDSEISQAKVLIVDGNATSRSVLTAQLRDLGVQHVRQTMRVQQARLALEDSPFDIVLCESAFDDSPLSGQDLLDELRREQLLPYSTAFILISSQATYGQVQDAAESTVDGYLVKPYSGLVLAERLAEVRRRKRALKPIYEAIQANDFARAAALAELRFKARDNYWSFAGQVAAELWLRAHQAARAIAIYEAVLEERPQLWATAGLARARMAMGELAAARRLLEAQTREAPGYADAHDLLARVLVEQGEFGPALESFRTASTLTPDCLMRMQHRGSLAFYQRHKDEALQHIERTVALGRKSKLFDVLCLALVGLLKFDRGDFRGLASAKDQLVSMSDAHPESIRVSRLRKVLEALVAVHARQPDEALVIARLLASEVMAPGFDLEAAALTISLWARLPTGEVPLKEFDALVRKASLRFCVSKACTEVLAASADVLDSAEKMVRDCHNIISNMAEQAMNMSMAGQADEAVNLLLEQGELTRNAKLIDMSGAVAKRHAKQLRDVDEVQARAKRMQDSYCMPPTHIAGVRRSARMPGGVTLRT